MSGDPLHVFPCINSLAADFKGILLDAYGVFWGGNHYGLLPGAKEAMERLVSKGKLVGVLSNATQPAAKEVDKLQKHGLIQGQHFHFFTTSAEVARQVFREEKLPFPTHKKKFWLFGEPHPRFASHEVVFQDSRYSETKQIQDADFIFIAIPHINGEDQTNPELFRAAVAKLKETNLPMVCINPDRFAHEGMPPKAVVRQGSIAALYDELGGKVYFIGKPSSLMYEAAMHNFQQLNVFSPEHVLMVGDTPETDIRGAKNFGMASALITKTGIMADRISHHGMKRALQGLGNKDSPHFLIERLGHGL